jgi:hypothetical protein
LRVLLLFSLLAFFCIPSAVKAQNASVPATSTQDAPSKRHDLTAARLINRINPEYPKKARKQHVEGTVRRHAIITRTEPSAI